MLSVADNELLTRTNKGTPAGEYFRRFWMPALVSEEVPTPDCPPVRVTLMGECLIAFRDTQGRVGLVGRYCEHRQMDLFYGRNEGGGIRCVYHGWKYDVAGKCIEMPTEPAESNYRNNVHLTSYPCKEIAGIVWAYLGPKEVPVEFPILEFNSLPHSHLYLRKSQLHCNYLQAMEGNLNSSHVGFLHSFPNGAPARGGKAAGAAKQTGSNSSADGSAVQTRLKELEALKRAPSFEIKDTDYGFMIGAKRSSGDGKAYWRIGQWMLPVHTIVGSNPGDTMLWDAWVPMDDEHTWVYRVMYNPWRPITEEEIYEYNNVGFMMLNVENVPGTYLPVRNRANDYLIDRTLQRTYSFTGIKGTNAQDAAAIENQGPTPICDRSKEHLGSADLGIIQARRKLLTVIRELQDGIEPLPALKGDLYNVRSISVTLEDNGVPFYEGARDLIFL